PGKKRSFMVSESGQTSEWNDKIQFGWWLLNYEVHRRFQGFCAALNDLYRSEAALYEIDFQPSGFEWIDFHDSQNSMVSFVRRAKRREDYLVVVCNFTPTPHASYRIGMPEAGLHREIFNSDAEIYGGSNMGNGGYVDAEATPSHGRSASATLVIPPLGVVVLKPARPLPPIQSASAAGHV
ncbi:MAG: alpha amylase C-terminal domain-containing protein, partial [Bryobacteraceae bacterium]